MSQFGDIPEYVLDIEMITIDEFEITLKELIEEKTNEAVETAKYTVSYDEDGIPYLPTFNAWTKNFILVLQCTTFGYHMDRYDRHPTKSS